MAAALVALLTLAMMVAVEISPQWRQPTQMLVQQLQVASLMVAIAVGGLAISRWYLTSDAPALWVGIALLLYGVIRLGAAELAPFVLAEWDWSQWLAWLRPASQVVMVVLLARATKVVPVASDVSALRLTFLTAILLAGTAALFLAVPALATLVDGGESNPARGYVTVNQLGLMPFAFTALAGTFTWQGYRRRRWLFAWLGLMLFTLALAHVTRVVAPPPLEAGLLGTELLRLVGLLFALYGATWEILYTYSDSSSRLARSEYTAMTAQERILQGQALAEERAHEARSALAAIEGATRTLEHYRDRLPAETQAALSTAVSGEIRRLQRLVTAEETPPERTPFSLAESLSPLVASERARDVEVDVDVPGDLDVIGSPSSTEQVLQALFDNARRYAPGTPVTVRASREDAWIVLRVEDRGPGVPPDQREAVFRRGVRGDHALDVPGNGLGLYVAAKLMRDQHAELWVDERAGGGASFAIALPAAEDDASTSTEDAVQRLQQAGEVIEGSGFSASNRGD